MLNIIERKLTKYVSEKLSIEPQIALTDIEKIIKIYEIEDKFLDILVKFSIEDVKKYLIETLSKYEQGTDPKIEMFDYYSLTGRLIYFSKKYILDESLAIMLIMRSENSEESKNLFENFLEYIYFNLNDDYSFGLEDSFISKNEFSEEDLVQWKILCSLKILAFLQIVKEKEYE